MWRFPPRLRGLMPVLLVTGALLAPVDAFGQQGPSAGSLPNSPVLTVDSERLFSGSRFGRKLSGQLEAEAAAIAAENREIEAELAQEERRLTGLRGTMEPEAFRELADAFDAKVSRIRREREERAVSFGQNSDAARRQFLAAAEPVLTDIMREVGAAVMLEQHSVFLARDIVDITDEAISRIDETLLPPGTEDGEVPADENSGLSIGEPLQQDPDLETAPEDAPLQAPGAPAETDGTSP